MMNETIIISVNDLIATISCLYFHCNASIYLGSVAIVKAEGEPVLCKTDEIGEILLSSKPQEVDSDSCYFGLTGLTEKIFKAHPTDGNSHGLVESACYTRTGLLGYLNPVSNTKSRCRYSIVSLYFENFNREWRKLFLNFWYSIVILFINFF